MTNKPKVKRYDDMGCPEQICRVDTMHESDDGDFVLYEDYKALQAAYEEELFQVRQDRDAHFGELMRALEQVDALQAECEKLRKDMDEDSSAVIDKMAKLLAGVAVALKGEEPPLHSHSYHDLPEGVMELRAECEELRRALAESQANDRQAMYYLNQVREIVGGDDFPDMVQRCRKLLDSSCN